MIATDRKEDYQLEATITGEDEIKIEKLRCKVFLPEKPKDRVLIILLPSSEQALFIERAFNKFWKFSILAERKELDETLLRISADNVYSLGMTSKAYGINLLESIWEAEPTDLRIEHILNREISPTECRFWITPSIVLTPAQIISSSYTGEVKVESVRTKSFSLSNDLFLNFQKHYKHRKNEVGDTVTTSYLVAETNLWNDPKGSEKIDDKLLRQLDDFLLLSSFASRQRSVCIGWEVFDSIGHTRFYRGNISIPDSKSTYYVDDGLIEPQHYEDFLQQAYSKFVNETFIDLLRDSIRGVLPHKGLTAEARFTSLFSSLETLVLLFRRQNNLEFIFSQEDEAKEWKETKKKMQKWLKEQNLLAGKEKTEKRKLVYENLSSLERISFSYAFNKHCDYYKVDLSDLWGITGGGNNWSLTTIRNKIVHGDEFADYKFSALFVATQHLQWTLERLLLAYFEWDLSKSYVNKDFLSRNLIAHQEQENNRKLIST